MYILTNIHILYCCEVCYALMIVVEQGKGTVLSHGVVEMVSPQNKQVNINIFSIPFETKFNTRLLLNKPKLN